jgi:hypothetical protein
MNEARDERFEQLRPKLICWLIVSAGLLVLTVAAIALTSGTEPILRTSEMERTIVALFGATAVIGVVFNGGLLLYELTLRKYGPRVRSR